ncbi:MAG: hypothetical protein EKK63_13855 [Acinetobacter sp.]|mgnify:FL=1|uniref:hypothetical protein n=1 Tax=Acinetobacter sp. TaxID=472 RepID=UPI000FAFF330|nr:hypothetical protein [Acinetobacter sp.]RUP37917.1 MAG: hypothetical protein EKK63_13855 [Acinetobacter sp.]
MYQSEKQEIVLQQLTEIELFFESGMREAMDDAVIFSGDDATPILKAHQTLSDYTGMLPESFEKAAKAAFNCAVEEFNSILDFLRPYTGGAQMSTEKEYAVKQELNHHMKKSLQAYREKLLLVTHKPI